MFLECSTREQRERMELLVDELSKPTTPLGSLLDDYLCERARTPIHFSRALGVYIIWAANCPALYILNNIIDEMVKRKRSKRRSVVKSANEYYCDNVDDSWVVVDLSTSVDILEETLQNGDLVTIF